MKKAHTTQPEKASTGRDILSIYFNDAGEYPLLTRDEEKKLVSQMLKWATNKAKCGMRTRRNGQKARETLIRSNLRLVIKLAKNYQFLGLDLADLINEGNMGLMKAVDKYDPNKGAKLSYYAAFWIKQSVTRALANSSRTVRLPVGVVNQKMKILKFVDSFRRKNNRKPHVEEVAKKFGLSETRAALLIETGMKSQSLSEPISQNGEGDCLELQDVLRDFKIRSPSVQAEFNSNVEVLEKLLSKLDGREQSIVRRRFGLTGESKPETLEKIGDSFGITRERIRQIESAALRKLRFWMAKEMKIKN
jgi:RNA polymerase primary sigma factor